MVIDRRRFDDDEDPWTECWFDGDGGGRELEGGHDDDDGGHDDEVSFVAGSSRELEVSFA